MKRFLLFILAVNMMTTAPGTYWKFHTPVGYTMADDLSDDLRIQATGDVTLTRDVEVQQGGSLTIQTNP